MYKILAIVGRSCCGKDTLARRIRDELNEHLVCSFTTRGKCWYETDGVEHYFIDACRMAQLRESNEVLAYSKHEKSGIEYCATLQCLDKDKLNVYIINPEGIECLRKSPAFKHCELTVVNLWADVETLRKRAISRGDDMNIFNKRIATETEEFARFNKSGDYDITISADYDADYVWNKFFAFYASKFLIDSCLRPRYDFKYVFVDFDDTACLHTWLNLSDDYRDAWDKSRVIYDVSWYIDNGIYQPNNVLSKFLVKVKSEGAKVYCLTHLSNTLALAPKRFFVDYYYPNMFNDILGSSSRTGKLTLVKDFCKTYNVNFTDVLIIDDHPDTLREFRQEGFCAISPVALQGYNM